MTSSARTPFSRTALRTRWAAAGAAIAVTLGAVGVATLSAANPASSFTAITPCRLFDTRPAFQVGPRATPLGPTETYTIGARGEVGHCSVPTSANGLSLTVTIANGTTSSFLTIFPGGEQLPNASSANWVAGQPPTPNAVTASLSADGMLSFYNLAGTVDVIVDVAGYYQALPSVVATTTPTTTAAPTTTTTTTTTLPAYRFESTFEHGGFSSYYPLQGTSLVGIGTNDGRSQGWMAPRNCTMTGSVVIVGGVATASSSTLGFILRFSALNQTGGSIRIGAGLQYVQGTLSGVRRTIPPMAVNAGELVVFGNLGQAGTTMIPDTHGYVSATCT
jgi:hypothetical protein